MDLTKLTENLSKLGLAGLLALVILTGYRGDWAWGTAYRDAVAERDVWKDLATKALHAGEANQSRIVGARPPQAKTEPTLDEVKDRIKSLESKAKGL